MRCRRRVGKSGCALWRTAKRVKAPDLAQLDLSCLRRAGCGAEPIQAKTLADFASKLAPARFDPKAFLPSYGMAEATLAVTFTDHRGTGHDLVFDESTLRGLRTDTVDGKGLAEVTPHVVALADYEGLPAHADSIRLRQGRP